MHIPLLRNTMGSVSTGPTDPILKARATGIRTVNESEHSGH